MAYTDKDAIYEIAEKLGYEGARTQSSAKGVYACADALGFVGPHARRITDALSDLKTVVGGGGGGGDLGAGVGIACTLASTHDCSFVALVDDESLVVAAAPNAEPFILPSGLTYYLTAIFDETLGAPVSFNGKADVAATKTVGETSEPFTDFDVVEVEDAKVIRIPTTAVDTGYALSFVVTNR